MKTYIVFNKPSFVVNKEKGAVTCIMDYRIRAPKGQNLHFFLNSENFKRNNNNYYGYYKAVGVAKCNSSDTFDEAFGMKVAESRAKKDAYRNAASIWRNVANKLSAALIMAEDIVDNISGASITEKKHIDELLGR